MKKIFLFFAALLCACSPEYKVNWMTGSWPAALDAARRQNKPIMVDFYSDT